jgi:TonB-linked SusC/RagA family outer membrane protein
MKTKFNLILTSLFFLFGVVAIAQQSVSGTVTDESGTPLPGVNIIVENTNNGTNTDFDGKYSIQANDGDVLSFSYLGFKPQNVVVENGNIFNMTLTQDSAKLDEVVVTAFGGSNRTAKEVVYANQTVGSNDLNSTPNKNALEALRGKTAGVKLSTGSGSVGASTRIVLRGEGSLTGNNNALIVIDGVAIDNSATRGGSGSSTTGYSDFGNRFNDVNPNDIESVTILKGPSATSLYGSRGGSGVILITTKKGTAGKMKVTYNGSASFDNAIILLQRQNQFGQGYDNASLDSGENWAWGPQLDGISRPWTTPIDSDGDGALESLVRPYSAVENQLKDFFETGQTISNNVSVSGTNDGFSYFGSFGNTNQEGILQNTYYKRNNISFNASAKLSDKIESNFKVSYARVKQNTAQEGSRAFEGNNAYAMAVQSPVNIPFTELKDYNSPFHDINGYWGSYSSVNPYYILNEYGNEATIDNFLANASITYNFLDNLSFTARFGGNIVNTQTDVWTPAYSPNEQLIWSDDFEIGPRNSRHESLGDYTNYNGKSENLDATFIANYDTNLTDDLNLKASAGYNYFQRKFNSISGYTVGGLVVPNSYNLANSAETPSSGMYRSLYRTYGVLGNATLGYQDKIFLELSARNDWSSTLPEENNSFFYGAVGVSAIITDLINVDSDIFNYGKIRGSFGTSGKDAGTYLLNSYFVGNPSIIGLGDYELFFPKDGVPGFTVGNTIGNPELKPELTTTYEIGTDVGLFNDVVSIAYTYYQSIHDEQIVTINLPRSTGYTTTVSNIGSMENKGHELSMTLKPIQGLIDGLNFELFGTYSKNENNVVKITDDIDEINVGDFGFGGDTSVDLVAKEGLPFGTFKGNNYKYNSAGQVIVDNETGFPVYSDEDEFLGNYQPDYLMNFGFNASYKGFGFRALFDMKKGGVFASQTKWAAEFNGTTVNTTMYNRQPFIFPNSVIENSDGTFSPNTNSITEQDFYTNYDAPVITHLIDASYLKFREVELSYTLPANMIENLFLTDARVAVYGKNLFFWLPEENKYVDPEVNGPALTGNAQGIDTTQTPTSRSFGINLQLSF